MFKVDTFRRTQRRPRPPLQRGGCPATSLFPRISLLMPPPLTYILPTLSVLLSLFLPRGQYRQDRELGTSTVGESPTTMIHSLPPGKAFSYMCSCTTAVGHMEGKFLPSTGCTKRGARVRRRPSHYGDLAEIGQIQHSALEPACMSSKLSPHILILPKLHFAWRKHTQARRTWRRQSKLARLTY